MCLAEHFREGSILDLWSLSELAFHCEASKKAQFLNDLGFFIGCDSEDVNHALVSDLLDSTMFGRLRIEGAISLLA